MISTDTLSIYHIQKLNSEFKTDLYWSTGVSPYDIKLFISMKGLLWKKIILKNWMY